MKVTVNKTCATVSGAEMLTSGMVGKTIGVEFSADWLGLIKIAVFTNGAVTRDVLNPDGTIIIPWEVLEHPNKRVSVGFYGYKMENGEKVLAIPTIWAELGAVRAGADPSGDPSAEPSPTVAEQLQSDVNDLDERVTELEEHGGGGGTSDHSQLTNRDAANQHPMSAITGLENALDGKGTYSKPSGGIPKTDLASAVQSSLSKADSALQEHQNIYELDTLPNAPDDFYVPVAEAPDGDNKRLSFDSLKVKLKTYFDTLYNKVTKTSDLTNDSGYITDAPSDSKEYARKNGAWAEVVGGGGGTWGSITGTLSNQTDLKNALDSKLNASEIKVDPNNLVYKIGSSFIAADYDGDGRSISSTYAKKTELSNYAEADKVVPLVLGDLDGNHTIADSDYIPLAEAPDGDAQKVNVGTFKQYINNGMASQSDLDDYVLKTQLITSQIDLSPTDAYEQDYNTQKDVNNHLHSKEAEWDAKLDASDLTDYALKTDLDNLQPKTIADTAGYFTTDTVEGALAEIGAELAGVNTLLGSGVIT